MSSLLAVFINFSNTKLPILIKFTSCDFAAEAQLDFQDTATGFLEAMIDLHHDVFGYLVFISLFVVYILAITVYLFAENWNTRPSTDIRYHTWLEIIWTLIPTYILFLIAVPSFALIYAMEELLWPSLTVKALGSQWYWNYEYGDLYRNTSSDWVGPYLLRFQANLVPEDIILDDMGKSIRLLSTDRWFVLPEELQIRLLVSAHDVLHCWTVPSFGVKIDGCPGRLNQVGLFIKRAGLFYGQCSEICGVNHGFMPIAVKVLPVDRYLNWVTRAF